MKPWYTSKVFWVNAITIVTTVAAFYGVTPDQHLAEQVAALLVVASPVINLILRLFTSKAITA